MNTNAECPTAASLRSRSGALRVSCPPTHDPDQHVHKPMLAVRAGQHDSESYAELIVPITGGRSQEYCDWWCEQVLGQDNHSLFSVRLIGDASSPQLYTLMAHNDLAYCRYAGCASLLFYMLKLQNFLFSTTRHNVSQVAFACHAKLTLISVYSKWGHNRVVKHEATGKSVGLVLPVLTRPDVVQQAVVGILCGEIGLTMLNVEDFLVLANAVGVSLIA